MYRKLECHDTTVQSIVGSLLAVGLKSVLPLVRLTTCYYTYIRTVVAPLHRASQINTHAALVAPCHIYMIYMIYAILSTTI